MTLLHGNIFIKTVEVISVLGSGTVSIENS